MAYADIYVKLDISKSSGYIHIDNFMLAEHIQENYTEFLESARAYGVAEKFESFDGHRLMHLHVKNVKYDGRSRKITSDDIKETLVEQGYAILVTETMLGGLYKPTEKLLHQLEMQLNKRKQLVNEGKFISLKSV